MESLTDAWGVPTDSKTTFPLDNLIKPSSRLELLDDFGVNNSRAIAMGKNCDEFNNFNAVALDLHIDADPDLQDSVTLSFFIRDNREESQQQDAIFLSVDNGMNFFKVYEFDFVGLSNSQFHEISINLSEKAEEAGSTLSEQTIVRFQQYDDADFSSNTAQTNDKDGIYLDSVTVSGKILSNYAEVNKYKPLIRVFPNPARNLINLEVENYANVGEPVHKIVITDCLGRIILQEERRISENGTSLDVMDLESGIYFLTVGNKNTFFTSKVIIR